MAGDRSVKIDINCDMAESFGAYTIGNDAGMMPLITSANVACGKHGGDPTVMDATVGLAKAHGVSVGAHPGFDDLWGFGRRQIRMKASDLEHLVAYQIGALQAIARGRGVSVRHVKPHGALNNMAHHDADYALAIARAIKSADPDLIFLATIGSEMAKAGAAVGLTVAHEAFADRLYEENGELMSRTKPGSVIREPDAAAAHVLRMLEAGGLVTAGGKVIPTPIHSFCIHGDEPTAVATGTAVRAALAAKGVDVVPLPALFA